MKWDCRKSYWTGLLSWICQIALPAAIPSHLPHLAYWQVSLLKYYSHHIRSIAVRLIVLSQVLGSCHKYCRILKLFRKWKFEFVFVSRKRPQWHNRWLALVVDHRPIPVRTSPVSYLGCLCPIRSCLRTLGSWDRSIQFALTTFEFGFQYDQTCRRRPWSMANTATDGCSSRSPGWL